MRTERPLLKLGMNNEFVKELQILLREGNYFNYPNATGYFGNITKEAVIKFQRDNGLKDDGIVGNKTWDVLFPIKPIIKPLIDNDVDDDEDFTDPEDEMKVDLSLTDDNLPTCKNTAELIELIRNSTITRNVTRLIYHCTATTQTATVEAITRYWREKLKWKSPGYHILIKPDGSWTYLQNFNHLSNGVAGYNSTSINISYIGGIDSKGKAIDNRTSEQIRIMDAIYFLIKEKLPNITFHGHNEFSSKACPSYNVKKDLERLVSKTLEDIKRIS